MEWGMRGAEGGGGGGRQRGGVGIAEALRHRPTTTEGRRWHECASIECKLMNAHPSSASSCIHECKRVSVFNPCAPRCQMRSLPELVLSSTSSRPRD
jgi:hypothetical protein